MVVLEIPGQRPAPHIVAHGDIHEQSQEHRRKYEPPPELGRFRIAKELLRFLRRAPPLFARAFPEARAVARALDGLYYLLGRGRTLDAH